MYKIISKSKTRVYGRTCKTIILSNPFPIITTLRNGANNIKGKEWRFEGGRVPLGNRTRGWWLKKKRKEARTRGVRGRPFFRPLIEQPLDCRYAMPAIFNSPLSRWTGGPLDSFPLPEVRWTRGLIPFLSGAPTWRSALGSIVTIPRILRTPIDSRSDFEEVRQLRFVIQLGDASVVS